MSTMLMYGGPTQTRNVLAAIAEERAAQDGKWGEQNHPDGTGSPLDKELARAQRMKTESLFKSGKGTWRDILEEEVYEALAESDEVDLEAELIQVAAVATAWVEAIRRRRDRRG